MSDRSSSGLSGPGGIRGPQSVAYLQAARDYLLEHGWHQGSYGPTKPGECGTDPDRPERCAYGALDTVCGRGNEVFTYRGAGLLHDAVRTVFPEYPKDFISFNDEPTTTFNDIMALFDEAIRVAKEEMVELDHVR